MAARRISSRQASWQRLAQVGKWRVGRVADPSNQGEMMSRQNIAIVFALLLPGLWGCAPDAWNSRQATGYNAFLNQIAKECYPLQMGNDQMSEVILRNEFGRSDNYSYFLDQTSRVYSDSLSREAYRSSINGFFLGGSTNVAIDCILSKLPQNQ
jgi:hypothetical protein